MKSGTLEIITESAQQTKKVGRILAEEILSQSIQKTKRALVIGLEGELGSGKTTFIQGLAKGLGIKEKITSPTFVILRRHKTPATNLYHIDCYRINSSQELIDLDFKEMLSSSQNIIVIEWAEQIKKILPPNTLWMKFEYLDKNRRKIIL